MGLSVVAFLFIILVCVMVHEFGHYITALWFGVKVHEFSFGMGPLLWQRQGRKNKWSVRAIPVGGFVRLGGMGEENEGETVLPGEGFQEKAPWKKLIILAAGAFNNILLVVVMATVMLMSRGVLDLSTSAVGELIPGFPAEAAGLRSGDVIESVDGIAVSDWRSMTQAIRSRAKQAEELHLQVRRGSEKLSLTMGTKSQKPGEPPLIGIRPAVKKLSFFRAVAGSLNYTFQMSVAMLRGLKDMIVHPSAADVSGPVGIAAMAGEAAREGFFSLLSFLAIISLNLGIINLLPFPALDGGHIVFAIGEMITGRNVSAELEGKIHFIGFMFLAALIVLITWQDILRLFGR
ncbi:MAG: RIP metalloprotease RseP [Pyramidobacter sp.]|nr:RIP metalloprotease RseP [Pyramidobacter sp.]